MSTVAPGQASSSDVDQHTVDSAVFVCAFIWLLFGGLVLVFEGIWFYFVFLVLGDLLLYQGFVFGERKLGEFRVGEELEEL